MSGTKLHFTLNEASVQVIKTYLKQTKTTQTVLGEKTGLSKFYLSRRLKQQVDLSVTDIERIARALSIDPAELLFPNRIVKLPVAVAEPILAVGA